MYKEIPRCNLEPKISSKNKTPGSRLSQPFSLLGKKITIPNLCELFNEIQNTDEKNKWISQCIDALNNF